MITETQRFEEPIGQTVVRNLIISIVVGGIVGLASHHLNLWPVASVLALWPTFGGHLVEVFFLNWVRPRLPSGASVQKAVRLIVWFAGGCLLTPGMLFTASLVASWRMPEWLTWWAGGLAFVGIELFMHLGIQLRGRAEFL